MSHDMIVKLTGLDAVHSVTLFVDRKAAESYGISGFSLLEKYENNKTLYNAFFIENAPRI